jgi:hypothetical protein
VTWDHLANSTFCDPDSRDGRGSWRCCGTSTVVVGTTSCTSRTAGRGGRRPQGRRSGTEGHEWIRNRRRRRQFSRHYHLAKFDHRDHAWSVAPSDGDFSPLPLSQETTIPGRSEPLPVDGTLGDVCVGSDSCGGGEPCDRGMGGPARCASVPSSHRAPSSTRQPPREELLHFCRSSAASCGRLPDRAEDPTP